MAREVTSIENQSTNIQQIEDVEGDAWEDVEGNALYIITDPVIFTPNRQAHV